VLNQSWVRWDRALFRDGRNSCLFVGEPDDAVGRLGLGLPDRRRHAAAHYEFLGYVVPCDPAELADRHQVRARLGYDARPLIVASIGGTAIGRELLELCAQAQPLIRRELPAAHMVLVCGPDLDPATVARDIGEAGDEGIDLRGFVTDLYEHFAACDVAVVQGGGTSTTELTALRRPFVYFPLEGHFEQEHDVAARLARHCAGVRMTRSRTTPERLAAVVVGQFGAVASYPPIPVDGAGKAARLILARLA
jgi:UDP-N-acetylglucosamine:LPS N-acetylglucosamine transferase